MTYEEFRDIQANLADIHGDIYTDDDVMDEIVEYFCEVKHFTDAELEAEYVQYVSFM